MRSDGKTRYETGAGLAVVLFFAVLMSCANLAAAAEQRSDQDWSPSVANPEFASGDVPVVLVDANHGNFHTIDGRYAAFAELLRLDGYRVIGTNGATTRELLSEADVFVISNAVRGGENAKWILPTPSAFESDEIEAIVQWVSEGGSLLLIADHMPFPGGTSVLANEFGIVFINGYAKASVYEGGMLSFDRSSGLLADHPVTRGRGASEAIESVTSFTGQAFRVVGDAVGLMRMPDDWAVFLPTEAGLIGEATPYVSTRGLVQGALLEFGGGRVAVFGEAAMFTAQTWDLADGSTGKMGLNHPLAKDNAQFLLNVMHWLSSRVE